MFCKLGWRARPKTKIVFHALITYSEKERVVGKERRRRRRAGEEEQAMAGMQRTRPWELSEAVWERAQPLLPAAKPHPQGGRPRRNDRQMLGAILSVLRTGMQWNALPREIGASTTVYD